MYSFSVHFATSHFSRLVSVDYATSSHLVFWVDFATLFATDTEDLQFKVGSEPSGDPEKHRKIHWCLAGFEPWTPGWKSEPLITTPLHFCLKYV